MASYAYQFTSGDTVTPTKLNNARTISNIVNADISATANIDGSKLSDTSINNSKLASGIDASKLTTGTLPIARIANGAVTQAKLAAGTAGNGPAFRAYASGTTSLTTGEATKVNLATESFDTANCFASSRFTPNVAGYYQFNYGVRTVGAVTALHATLHKNGTIASAGALQGATSATNFNSVGADLLYMNGTTDYVELFAYHNTGTSETAEASESSTFLSGFLARSA